MRDRHNIAGSELGQPRTLYLRLTSDIDVRPTAFNLLSAPLALVLLIVLARW